MSSIILSEYKSLYAVLINSLQQIISELKEPQLYEINDLIPELIISADCTKLPNYELKDFS